MGGTITCQVSILVVMDIALKPIHNVSSQRLKSVSILVVMDIALKRQEENWTMEEVILFQS